MSCRLTWRVRWQGGKDAGRRDACSTIPLLELSFRKCRLACHGRKYIVVACWDSQQEGIQGNRQKDKLYTTEGFFRGDEYLLLLFNYGDNLKDKYVRVYQMVCVGTHSLLYGKYTSTKLSGRCVYKNDMCYWVCPGDRLLTQSVCTF